MTDPYSSDPLDDVAAAPAPSPVAPAASPGYLDGLNPAQRAAVEALDGPVLVLAGAGTGKTRVLTTRLAHLLLSRKAWPSQILAVTFTNKAAREMRERVEALTGAPTEGWWLGTFHALAARMLRRHAELVGLRPDFTILDTDDQIRLIKQLLEAENLDAKRWPARLLLSVIERWKDRGLAPDKLKPEDAGDVANGRMLALYQAYQERLRSLNACDFGDLLLHCLTLFQAHPDVLADWQRRFRYLLVDEYQDTNVAQYLWLRLLAQGSRNLCCVGDEDQSIYGWRGAEIGNILRFEADFPGAQVIRLEQNYRSTERILAAASGLIAHNQSRLGKTLFTQAAGGDSVVVHTALDSEAEAVWVADEIEAVQRKGTSLDQVAVLVRAGFQMRAFEERFSKLALPYRVIGGPRFYERLEIRDALAYLRVINQPDDDLAFERIVNTPKRGIGDATVQVIHRLARGQRIGLLEASARLIETDELKPRARKALGGLVGDFVRWREIAGRLPHTDLARLVLDESGYTAHWQADKSAEAPGRLENLKELVNGMEEFETLTGFLEHVALVTDATGAAAGPCVTLMTLHAAKGLEFDHVFLPGWEEGLFPHQRAVDENGITGLEEERRLAYVGLTRARRRAYISTAQRRPVHGLWQDCLPSRFLGELPEAAVDRQSDVQVDGGFGGGLSDPVSAFRFQAPRGGFGGPRKPPPVLDGAAYSVADRAGPDRPYVPGDRVFHQKFGYGTVRAADAGKLTIAFDHTGEKRVMDSFVARAEEV